MYFKRENSNFTQVHMYYMFHCFLFLEDSVIDRCNMFMFVFGSFRNIDPKSSRNKYVPASRIAIAYKYLVILICFTFSKQELYKVHTLKVLGI